VYFSENSKPTFMIKNIFEKQVVEEILTRLEKLKPSTPHLWGKMNASQMLAHLNVTYEMTYENTHKKPNFFMSFMLKTFVKKKVVGDTIYSKNSPTAPAFVISNEKDFDKEKSRLIDYIHKTQKLGTTYFENKENLSFGVLTSKEWNNLFYKHIDHHFSQFGI
jgi:hypothetical protein